MARNGKLVIFGAGGHGRVIAEMAADAGWNVIGFVDDAPVDDSDCGFPVAVLGSRQWLLDHKGDDLSACLGIGDNYVRKSLTSLLLSEGIEIETVISPRAIVSPTARIGRGAVIMPGAIINSRASIGEGAIVNSGAILEHDTKLGDFAHLSPQAVVGGAAKIGELAHVGLGACVLPMVSIGRRSVLGAGAVATREIRDGVIAYGVPARIVRAI